MFGSTDIRRQSEERREVSHDTVLELREITALDDRGFEALSRLSFTVKKGEIFGIAGVDGNGQKELAELVAGQRRVIKGEIKLDGTAITNRGIGAALKSGIWYVTDDRMGEGCVGNLSVAENMIPKRLGQEPFSRSYILSPKAITEHTQSLMAEFGIKAPGPWARVSTLSGGNIQKLLLARELSADPRVLVCNNPTHGLDIMTTRFIQDRIRLQSEQGTAVILISSDLDEILEMSDRVGVIFEGQIHSAFPVDRVSREEIGKLMLGIREEDVREDAIRTGH
jgi:simple sugar transport system ATP-binding protein